MKNVIILGCSYSAGAEVPDEFIIPGYWDFINDSNFKIGYIMEANKEANKVHWKDLMKRYDGDYLKYIEDCYNRAWPSFLKQNIKDINLYNYSVIGVGIDFFQTMYNGFRYKQFTYVFDKLPDFKETLLEADLLIWQMTYEPRFLLTGKDMQIASSCVNIGYIQQAFDIDYLASNEDIQWKKNLYIKFRETCFDEYRFSIEKINFLNLILNERILRKKPSLIFSLYPSTIQEKGFDINPREYVHHIGLNNKGIFSEMIKDIKDDPKIMCKFGHPSARSHIEMEKYIRNYIVENNLI